MQSENTDACGGCPPEFVRWRGARKLRTRFDPDFPGNEPTVYGIAVPEAGVSVVGVVNGRLPLVAYGNGRSWRIQQTSFSRLRGTPLYAISALSSTEIWVVGNHLLGRYSR